MFPVAKKTSFAGIKPQLRKRRPLHLVAVLAFDGVVLTDFAIPCDVFGITRLADGQSPYDVRVCGVRPTAASAFVNLTVGAPLTLLRKAGTIVIPGMSYPDCPIPEAL